MIRGRVARVTPIGVRPWDLALDLPAASGLAVTARRPGGRSVVGVGTPSGCYAVYGLPGLHAAEYPDPPDAAGGATYWYQPPVSGPVRIEIVDPVGRYLPVAVETVAPQRGLVLPPCSAPGPDAPVVPLWSAPGRPVPPGCGAVRAQLELASGARAAWALLDVELPDGTVAHGMADGAGAATVIFAWPEPDAGIGPLTDAAWTVTVSARFGGQAGSGSTPVAAGAAPELCVVLAQPAVTVLADAGQELPPVRLRFGRDLVLRSSGRSSLLLSGPA